MRKKDKIFNLQKELNLDIQLKSDLVSSNTKMMELIHLLNDTMSEEDYLMKLNHTKMLIQFKTNNHSKPKKKLNKSQWNKKKKKEKIAKKSRKINRK